MAVLAFLFDLQVRENKREISNAFFRLAYFVWIQIAPIKVIFTHLKLWVAVARGNFKWVKI